VTSEIEIEMQQTDKTKKGTIEEKSYGLDMSSYLWLMSLKGEELFNLELQQAKGLHKI
jgi:hypothetical protein